MSLSSWEQQVLDSIKDGLTGSDPKLVALLGTFTRLASDEEMPAHEKIRSTYRRAGRRSLRRRRRSRLRRIYRRLGFGTTMLLLWLLISVMMIALALLLNYTAGPA